MSNAPPALDGERRTEVMTFDTNNRARSIMGPECAFCGHRLQWHASDDWKRSHPIDLWCAPGSDCRCARFDRGIYPGWFGIGWHQRILRHHVEDTSVIVTDEHGHQHWETHARCSCGKEWQ